MTYSSSGCGTRAARRGGRYGIATCARAQLESQDLAGGFGRSAMNSVERGYSYGSSRVSTCCCSDWHALVPLLGACGRYHVERH